MGSMGFHGIYGIPCPKCKYLSKEKWKTSTWGILSASIVYKIYSFLLFYTGKKENNPPVLTHLSINPMRMSWLAFFGKSTIPLPRLLAKLQTAKKLFFSLFVLSVTQEILSQGFLLWVASLSLLNWCHNN